MRLLMAFFLLIMACGKSREYIHPSEQSITESVYASGVIKGKNQYQVYATVSGIVDSIYYSEGDTVKAGDVIMSLVNDVQRITRENAVLSANYAAAGANKGKLEEAEQQLEAALLKVQTDSAFYYRQRTLWEQQVGSKAELEQKELQYKNAKATYRAALTHYDDVERMVTLNARQSQNSAQISNVVEGDFKIRSRINGVIYNITKEKGELVNPQQPVAVIGEAVHYLAELQIDEYDIAKVRPGMKVMISMDSYRDSAFEAELTRINPLMNDKTKTFTAEAEFISRPEKLFPNTSLEANIILQKKDKALIIPANVLIGDDKVVLKNGDTVKITTGLRDYKMVEVLSGVNAKDEIQTPAK